MKKDVGDLPLSLFPTDVSHGEKIHDRMPLVLRPEETPAWLADQVDFGRFFDRSDVMLEHVPA